MINHIGAKRIRPTEIRFRPRRSTLYIYYMFRLKVGLSRFTNCRPIKRERDWWGNSGGAAEETEADENQNFHFDFDFDFDFEFQFGQLLLLLLLLLWLLLLLAIVMGHSRESVTVGGRGEGRAGALGYIVLLLLLLCAFNVNVENMSMIYLLFAAVLWSRPLPTCPNLPPRPQHLCLSWKRLGAGAGGSAICCLGQLSGQSSDCQSQPKTLRAMQIVSSSSPFPSLPACLPLPLPATCKQPRWPVAGAGGRGCPPAASCRQSS